jgi:streptogramin lyase
MTCHDAQRIVRSRGNEARWQQVLRTMTLYAQGSTMAKAADDDEDKALLAISRQTTRPAPGVCQGQARSVQPPSAHAASAGGEELHGRRIRAAQPAGEPHEVAVDSEGNGWVSQRVGGRLGRLDRKTLTYIEYEPPCRASTIVRLNGIRRGNGGELWMVDGGPNRRWLSFDPKTETFCRLRSSADTQRQRQRQYHARASRQHGVARCDRSQPGHPARPGDQAVHIYDVPVRREEQQECHPYGMAVGGDGNIWIVENAFDQIARVDRATGKFDEYPLSVKDPVARKLGADWDGNLWVGLHGAGKLLRVDYKTLKMTEFTPPSEDAGVYLAEPDLKNQLMWTTLHHVDKLGRLDPATGKWAEYPLMMAETDVRRIDLDPTNSNRVWYSGVLSSRIGYVELLQ